MAVSSALFSHKSDDWATPAWLLEGLEWWFGCKFYDPCPLHADFDGLKADWTDRVYINPPYSNAAEWVGWGRLHAYIGECLVVMLLPARTDTRWFHDYVLPHAQQVWFLRGRLKFGGSKNSAPFPSMVVVFDGRL